MDLENLEKNTADGLHLASLAGSWIALVAGFGGMRHREEGLFFAPRLPAGWRRARVRGLVSGHALRVEIEKEQATYTLESGDPIDVHHHGGKLTLEAGKPTSLPLPHPVAHPPPRQPPGRDPRRP